MGWLSIALIFVVAVSVDRCEGCTCARPNDLDIEYCNDERELILRGVALNETLDNGGTIAKWDDSRTYAFRITEVIKATGNASGIVEGKNVVNIQARTEESLCGTSLRLGTDYVIVFRRFLSISLCDWVKPYDELEHWDLEVFEDQNFNCILRNCIPMGEMELLCCNEDYGGEFTCTQYRDCSTNSVQETTRCCTTPREGPISCVDYPGFLKKK